MLRYYLPVIDQPFVKFKAESGRIFTLNNGRHEKDYNGNSELFSHNIFEVFHDGKLVGRLFDGYAYGWGKIHGSLKVQPPYGSYDLLDSNFHDTPPMPCLIKAFEFMANRVDYILTYIEGFKKPAVA
ncbi:unnamed protein product [Sphagnum jensenii]|uniref:Uncharacterized protein n=1 Tax=Sphagnum jensenii TaxID=128206 RepID=A0ABP0V9Z8_9BRYO